MIDLHSHIAFDVDDGSDSFDESVAILKKAYKRGIKGIFATPHYMSGMYAEKTDVENKLDMLRIRLESEGIYMPIYSGHELFIDLEGIQSLFEGKVNTLNKSRYVLVELPMLSPLNDLNHIMFELTLKGFVPIIAHPERYSYVQKDVNVAKAWIEQGFLLQLNLPTFYGKYGEDAKKTAIKMLKRNMIHFVGTDVHSQQSTALSIAAPLKAIKDIVGDEMYQTITMANPIKVVENKDITAFDIKQQRFSLIDIIKNRIG
jgi:protein-tyrosine phosphatase